MEDTFQGRFTSICKTVCCFVVFLVCVQPLILCYLIVSICRLIWRHILEIKYSNLEFVQRQNLRSLIDTSRNPGIVNIILHLEGEYNVDSIKETVLNGVLQRRNKYGDYCFPKLRSNLVSCWGNYAWKCGKDIEFNINNHITLYPTNYRGRPVSELNVQDYISNIVSKYLQPDQPPWQICIVPLASSIQSRTEEPTVITSTDSTNQEFIETISSESSSTQHRYYIIVRMHHLLLSEEPDLRLNELLQIESFVPASIGSCESQSGETSSADTLKYDLVPSPLANIIDCPVYIPQLYNRMRIVLSNLWNEFLCNYDPCMKLQQCGSGSIGSSSSSDVTICGNIRPKYFITTLFAALVISFVTVVGDFIQGYHATRSNPLIKIKFLNNLIKRELRKRDITWTCIGEAITTSLNPIQMTKMTIAWMWWALATISLMWPYWAYKECVAFRCCCFLGYAGYPNTITGCLFEFAPLLYKALLELIQIMTTIFQAPRGIYEELIENNNSYEHALQNISLCGRKVLSWSDKISIKSVREACIQHRISPTELYFSAAGATLSELLHGFEGVPVPNQIRTFTSHVVHDYLLGKTDNSSETTGHLCVRLPIQGISIGQINKVQTNFQSARRNQTALYFLFLLQRRFDILTKILPNVWTVIIFNYLSRRFTVSITEISKTGKLGRCAKAASTICWGHPIIDAMYFSPPQTNASISLSVQQFGEHIQLGVMADAQIHPMHLKISDGWARNIQKLF